MHRPAVIANGAIGARWLAACAACVIVLVSLPTAPCSAGHWDGVVPLELVKVLPVEGPADANPSGLVHRDGRFYTVSDKHCGIIYSLTLHEDRAVMHEHVKFGIPPGVTDIRARMKAAEGGKPYDPDNPELDMEGIALDERGNFYIVAERCFCVIKVRPGGEVAWVSPSFFAAGRENGLFATDGAGPEAIGILDEMTLLVAAEREPRGLLIMDLLQDPPAITAYNMNETGMYLAEKRNPDITSLHVCNGKVWCLGRNAETIYRLEWNDRKYWEKDVYYFGHIVNRTRYRYQDMMFGMAEGFTMDDDYVYILLDNNGIPRRHNPGDKRPLLIITKRPPNMR